MGNFEIGDFVVAVIVLTMVVLGGTMIYGDIIKQNQKLSEYNIPELNNNFINETEYKAFNDSFNKMDKLNSDISSLKREVNATTPGDNTGFLSSINSMIKTGFNGVKFMLSSFNIMDSMFDAIPNYLKLGDEGKWISTLLKLLLITLILFAIYKLIFRSPTV